MRRCRNGSDVYSEAFHFVLSFKHTLYFGTFDCQGFGCVWTRFVVSLAESLVTNVFIEHEGLNGGCMHVGVTLRQLMDGNLKRPYIIDTCRDLGCCDIMHLTRPLEVNPIWSSMM